VKTKNETKDPKEKTKEKDLDQTRFVVDDATFAKVQEMLDLPITNDELPAGRLQHDRN
jgi:hypothetical protein